MINPKTYAQNPKAWRPFKTWISFYPKSFGVKTPRLTVYRELGRFAVNVYDQLLLSDLIKLPHPQSNIIDSNGSLVSGIRSSLACHPTVGQTPAYIFVGGHFYSTRDIKDPYSTKPVFSGGVLYDIPSGNPALRAPKLEVLQDVKDLKDELNTAISAVVPDDINYQIDKIDYLGLIFGVGGIHFPR